MSEERAREQELIDLYFDDLITAEELVELETGIQNSPELAAQFCDQADLQVMLHRVASSEADAAGEKSKGMLIHFPPLRIQQWFTVSPARKIAALAASVLIAVGLALIGTSSQGEDMASIIPLGPGIRLDRGGSSIAVTNEMLLLDDDEIFVATNSHAKIYWSESCDMALDGYSETRYDTESAWRRKLHKIFILIGKADISHDHPETSIEIGSPHIHYTRIKNSKVTFIVRPKHTHLKVDEGQLVATASRDGELHNLTAGDEAVILHADQ